MPIRHRTAKFLVILLPLLLAPRISAGDTAADLEAMTGAQTRVVWLRGANGGFNPYWDTAQYSVMAFDSREGKERELAPLAKIAWPRITPDGARVIYNITQQTELKNDSTAMIVDWDGKNRAVFAAPGYCYAVWRDPATGYQWAYLGEKYCYKTLKRCRIDNPAISEEIFGEGKGYTMQDFWISGDGKLALGLWPHPRISIIDLATGVLGPQVADGCNVDFAPDDSHMWFHMDGRHRVLLMYDANNRRIGEVPVHEGGEGMNGKEVWNPGWTNKKRFFSICGPFEKLHLPGSNIYVGKFDENCTKVEKYIRITNTADANVHQYCWIDPDEFGPQPTDKIRAVILAGTVERLAKAKEFKPILEELAKVAADNSDPAKAAEARVIASHLEGWGHRTLKEAKALEADDFLAAYARYQDLAARYAGLEAGEAAKQRLADPAVPKELESWKPVIAIRAALKELTTAGGKAEDAAKSLAALNGSLATLQKDNAGSKAEAAGKAAAQELATWKKQQLTAAKAAETTTPLDAEAIYKDLQTRFGDATAKARLADKDFKRQLNAWNTHLTKMLKAESGFKDVPGAHPVANDKAWLQKNRSKVESMIAGALALKKGYEDTAAWKEAQKLLEKYEIDLEPKKN